MINVRLRCQCGSVQGTATHITPSSGNRVVCCCDDCQAFATFLGQDNTVLDEFGGTEVFQVSQSQVTILQGHDQLKSMRLTPKGLLRWYTGCCHTAIGNTLSAGLPLIGLVHTFMDVPDREKTLGPILTYVQTQHAIKPPVYPVQSAKFPLGIIARMIRKTLIWKLTGKGKPSPFFDDRGLPIVKPLIVSK